MRKVMFFLRAAAVFIACLTLVVGCSTTAFKPIPSGYVAKDEHFDKDGFQDYTDYCKYYYSSPEPFAGDKRYHAITASEIAEVAGYFENFHNWMEIEDRLDEYDFSPDRINAGDYVLIETKEELHSIYDNYTVYFFDVESLILYYIHSNI